MFGMSMTELAIIAVLALILIGPDDLPKAARTIGKTFRDIQKAGDELRDTFEREVMSEVKKPTDAPPGAIAKGSVAGLPKTLGSALRDLQKAGDNLKQELMADVKLPSDVLSAPVPKEESVLPAPVDPNASGGKKGAA